MKKNQKIILCTIFAGILALTLNLLVKSPAYSQSQSDINNAISRVKLENTPLPTTNTSTPSPYVVTDVLAGRSASGQWVQQLYNVMRGILNILLVVILIVIAFANILHINIETYAIKKMLPKIIIVAVVANLAMILFALGSGVIDRLQGLSLFKPRLLDFTYITGGMWAKSGWLGAAALIASFIVTGGISGLACGCAFIIFFGSAIITILLDLILTFRPYIVFLAAAVSPLAIACYILPQTQSFFKKWLNIALVWLFMPLVVYGIMNIGDLIPNSTGYVAGAGGFIGWLVGNFLPTLLRAGLLLLAIRFPFMVEKDISGLIAKAGKYVGQGAITGGASLGNIAYQVDKKNLQRSLEGARRTSSLFNPSQDKSEYIRARKEYYSNTGQDKDKNGNPLGDDTLTQNAEKEWNDKNAGQRKKAYSQAMIKNAFENYTKGKTSKRILGFGAVVSMPLGVWEGVKANRAMMAEERSKQGQKLLFRHLGDYDPLKILEEQIKKKSGGKFKGFKPPVIPFTLRGIFDPESVRGPFYDKKYFGAIASADLSAKDLSLEDIADYIGPDTFRKLHQNAEKAFKAEGKTASSSQITKFIKDELDSLNTRDENEGTFAQIQITEGLTNMEVAVLKQAYGKMKSAALRQNLYGGGRGTLNRMLAERDIEDQMSVSDEPVETDDEFKQRLRDQGYPDTEIENAMSRRRRRISEEETERRTTRAPSEKVGEAPAAPPTVESDPKVTNYLSQIAESTKGLGGLDGVKSAITLAQGAGINPGQAGLIERKNELLMTGLRGKIRDRFMTDQEMRRFAHILEAENPADLGGRIGELKTRTGNDPEISKMLDEYQAGRIAYLGALANTPEAQSVQKYAVEIAPKIAQNPDLGRQLQAACDTVLNVRLNLKPDISPQEFNNASRLIGQHIPGLVQQTDPETGETTFDVSEGVAAKLARSIQALISG